MASSSTPSFQKTFKYDVFLSFRGEDTRKTFVDHLYHALEKRGIITYKDDEKIEKGKRISDELIRSIEDSKFYIIVFSKNYASSSWCLQELVKIMECQRMTDHTAYSVFYDVEPTNIRKQCGPVKRAFAKHRNENAAGKWRHVMKEAADLAGWELKNTANGHEAKFIQKIVEEISPKLLCINLSVDSKLVGMEARVKEVVLSLETGNNDVRMIGIKGMGGGGKTTLARAVFDRISMKFEGSSFVENVREVSNDSSKGLRSLQKQVLSDLLNDQTVSVSGVSDGKNKLKRMLRCRKVLLVVDDVDHIEHLEALAGEPNWFKPGSRIIITTREEHVLETHQVNLIRDVNLLSDEEAICLFSRYAFKKDIPFQGYQELSKRVVRYAAGLPLTVKVLGSFLYRKTVDEWTDALERLKTIPLKETLEILELSYNGLEDDYKEIFLDVACVLKGWEKHEAIRALESCGFHAKIGLKVLQQKSLITIYNNSYGNWVLGMHDHIELMGKNIVRRLHPNEPHKHSRLWKMNEIEDVLANDLGTEATRCICLWNRLHPATIMKGLRKMTGLRFLHVMDYREHNNDDFFLEDTESYVLDGLQYLSWDRYPSTCLPKNIQVNNVVQLQMRDSNIRQLWVGGERKVLDKVTYINLSFSKLRTLDLGRTPNVETLILRYCSHLVKLHMHGETPKLKFLDLSGSKLRTLDLGPNPNLERLILGGCYNLLELHMHGKTPKLKFLDVSCSKHLRIVHLGQSPNLEVLSLKGCEDLEELHMPVGCIKLKSLNLFYHPKLSTLNLSHTLNLEKLDIMLAEDLVALHMPIELKSLSFQYSRLRTLDLAQITNLEEIKMKFKKCDEFVELIMPVESVKLKSFELSGSTLRTLDLSRTANLETLCLGECDDLVELHMPVESLKLKSLMLSDSKLRTLDLARTPNLETLYLMECEDLAELQLQAVFLLCLRELTLDGCFLEVPKDLHLLECLEKLTLSSKKIKRLPSSICMLKHLKVLELLSCFRLEELPEDLGRLECLDRLTLSSEKIKHLPSSICMLKHLKVLNLVCSNLEELPENLGSLDSLEELTLPCEEIKHLPNSICMLKHLKVLDLRCCWLLGQLPEDLGRLECLEDLYLSCRKIKHLPKSICRLKHLKVLSLEPCMLLEQLPVDLGRLEFL